MAGGDAFRIQILPQCTITDPASNCVQTFSGGFSTVVAEGLMTDNGDGTYSYSYTPTVSGTATVSIVALTRGAARIDYYANSSRSGQNWIVFEQTLDFSFSSTSSPAPNVRGDNLGANISGYLCFPGEPT